MTHATPIPASSLQAAPIRWQPDRTAAQMSTALPPLSTALARGFAMKCPCCGQAPLFAGYLTVTPVCKVCDAPLGQVRADDAPPYFTIVAVGHVVVPAMLVVEKAYEPALWAHALMWLPLTLGLSLLLLRPIKGATVGLMMKLGMMKSGDEA